MYVVLQSLHEEDAHSQKVILPQGAYLLLISFEHDGLRQIQLFVIVE